MVQLEAGLGVRYSKLKAFHHGKTRADFFL